MKTAHLTVLTGLATGVLLFPAALQAETVVSPVTGETAHQPNRIVHSQQRGVKMTHQKEDPTIWEQTKEMTNDAWEATKSGASTAWDKTKEVSEDAWEATKSGASAAWEKTKEVSSDAWDAVTGDDDDDVVRTHHQTSSVNASGTNPNRDVRLNKTPRTGGFRGASKNTNATNIPVGHNGGDSYENTQSDTNTQQGSHTQSGQSNSTTEHISEKNGSRMQEGCSGRSGGDSQKSTQSNMKAQRETASKSSQTGSAAQHKSENSHSRTHSAAGRSGGDSQKSTQSSMKAQHETASKSTQTGSAAQHKNENNHSRTHSTTGRNGGDSYEGNSLNNNNQDTLHQAQSARSNQQKSAYQMRSHEQEDISSEETDLRSSNEKLGRSGGDMDADASTPNNYREGQSNTQEDSMRSGDMNQQEERIQSRRSGENNDMHDDAMRSGVSAAGRSQQDTSDRMSNRASNKQSF